ncbi:MAG: hypothetical protein JWM88_3425 [Verrucomicrobia bacterium]|nr:hypothetical protein [Lacunisphaera sp.]MDB6170561.1 hypothetical protein [Verrucomicrobiota bacterium]
MSPHLPKRFLGRVLFEICDRVPAARPFLSRWGLRTSQEWFEGSVPTALSPTGRQLRLASFGENYLSFELFWRGLDYYEPLTTALAVALTRKTGLFVDAGANVGFHSLMLAAARPELDIVAFEPHPRLNGLLQANIRANGFTRITAEQMALSDREGVMPFYLNKSDMSASLERSFDSNHSGVVCVPVTTLDSYFARRGQIPERFLLKVDVEGHEPHFFNGAAETLRHYQPDIIAEAAVPYPPETIAQLRRAGYHFRQVTDEGLRPCETPTAYVRGPLVFLNCLLTTRTDAELDRISDCLVARARSLDLRKTSKLADRRVLERCRSRATDVPLPPVRTMVALPGR